MGSRLGPFWAAIWYEIKMAWRRPAWWAWAMLCLGIGWLSIDRGKLPWTTVWRLALTPANALAVWGSVLLPIFAVGTYLREMSTRYEWYWVRLQDERVEYASKFVAVYMSMCLGLTPAYLYTAYFLAKYYGIQGLVLQGRLWPVLILPSFGASLAITLTLSLTMRSVFPSILSALAIVGGLIFTDWDATHLFALAPTTVFYSATTGFEPARSLFYLNRAFWSFGAAFFLWLSLCLARRVQPRVTQPAGTFWRFGFPSLMVIALISAGGIGLAFQGEHQRVFYQTRLPPAPKAMSSCEWLERYTVSLVIDATAGLVSGTVHLRTAFPQVTASYHLTPGLFWVAPSNTNITLNQEQSTLTLDAGEDLRGDFTLEYRGWPRVPKEFVICRSCLNIPEYYRYPFPDGWYMDSSSIFLTRDGGWHPFPNCAPDRLTLSIKNFACQDETCLAHTADEATIHSGLLQAKWVEVPAGPLLAATQRYVTEEVKGVTAYMPVWLTPESLDKELIQPYALALSRAKEFGLLDGGGDHLKLAVVPLFRYPRFSDRGVLFVPERALLSRANASEEVFARFAAEQVTEAWWCSGFVCPDIMQTVPYDFWTLPSVDDSNPHSGIRETLTQYTALRLIFPDVPLAEIDPREFAGSDAALMQRLDMLYNQNREDYWQIVRRYREFYGVADMSLNDFEGFVANTIGRSLPKP